MRGLPVLLLLLSAGCDSPAGGPDGGPVGMPVSCGEEPCAYVISALWAPRMGEDGRVLGLDLDDRVSDESDEAGCGRPDFVAPDGTPGVDNQFARQLESFENAIGASVDDAATFGIADGQTLHGVRLEGIDSTEDRSVTAVAGALRLPPRELEVQLDEERALAAGQSFFWEDTPTEGDGAIEDGILEVPMGRVDVVLLFDDRSTVSTFPIHDARLRVPFGDGGPGEGVLAGRLHIEDLLGTVSDAPPDTSLIRRTLEDLADLDPNAAGMCQSISIALGVGLVRAQIEP